MLIDCPGAPLFSIAPITTPEHPPPLKTASNPATLVEARIRLSGGEGKVFSDLIFFISRTFFIAAAFVTVS
jgi:hypothetical protein